MHETIPNSNTISKTNARVILLNFIILKISMFYNPTSFKENKSIKKKVQNI